MTPRAATAVPGTASESDHGRLPNVCFFLLQDQTRTWRGPQPPTGQRPGPATGERWGSLQRAPQRRPRRRRLSPTWRLTRARAGAPGLHAAEPASQPLPSRSPVAAPKSHPWRGVRRLCSRMASPSASSRPSPRVRISRYCPSESSPRDTPLRQRPSTRCFGCPLGSALWQPEKQRRGQTRSEVLRMHGTKPLQRRGLRLRCRRTDSAEMSSRGSREPGQAGGQGPSQTEHRSPHAPTSHTGKPPGPPSGTPEQFPRGNYRSRQAPPSKQKELPLNSNKSRKWWRQNVREESGRARLRSGVCSNNPAFAKARLLSGLRLAPAPVCLRNNRRIIQSNCFMGLSQVPIFVILFFFVHYFHDFFWEPFI